MAQVRIAPSLLAADAARFHEAVALIDRSEATDIHFDVMDGQFVPNISFGLPVLKALRPLTKKVMDVHLMIAEADRYLEAFAEAGADVIHVHVEASPHLHRSLGAIRSLGLQAGVAINPHTPIEVLAEIHGLLDRVLVMSVNPGYGGQAFIPESVDKVARIRQLLDSVGCKADIEVDGGVGPANAALLAEAGATILVAGNAVFASDDPSHTIRQMMAV